MSKMKPTERIVQITLHDPDENCDINAFALTALSANAIDAVYTQVLKQWEDGDEEPLDDEIAYGDIPAIVADKIGTFINMETYAREL